MILDDTDSVFGEEDSVQLLKAALDTKPKRKISWSSTTKALGDTPDQFIYEGAMIFISNVDFQAMADAKKGKLWPHIDALINRCLYLDLDFRDSLDVMAWIRHLVTTAGILIQAGLNAKKQEEVLAWMEENRPKIRSLSIRTAEKIAGLVKMWPDAWQGKAAQMELRKASDAYFLTNAGQ